MKQQDFHAAILHLKSAEQLEPKNPHVHMFLFSSYCEIGDFTPARFHFVRLYELDPELAKQLPISDTLKQQLWPSAEAAPAVQAAAAPLQTCPHCHNESTKNFLVCSECGHINQATLLTYVFLAAAGLALGISGLLALDNVSGSSSTWEIVKITLCGLPGLFFAGTVLKELARRSKSKNWPQRHAQEMQKLIGFYAQNPRAAASAAGKFMDRSSQWVDTMLAELAAEGKILRSEDRVEVVK
jgi:hypothetical protein